jgi:hypothetical protein
MKTVNGITSYSSKYILSTKIPKKQILSYTIKEKEFYTVLFKGLVLKYNNRF